MSEGRIAVLGCGANGASVAADLTRAGLDVTLVEQWPEHVRAMRADGLRIEMPDETLSLRSASTTSARSPPSGSPSTSSWC